MLFAAACLHVYPQVYFQHGSNKMMFYGDPTQFGKPRKMVRTLTQNVALASHFVLFLSMINDLLPRHARDEVQTRGYCNQQYGFLSSSQDLLLSRQMIYDNSFEWITTQGWSFLPLDNYGGGAAEAKFRPLEVNVVDYDLAWAQYLPRSTLPSADRWTLRAGIDY